MKHSRHLKKADIPLAVNGGKVCRLCFIEKEYTAYASDKSRKSGLHPYCQECRNRQKSSPEGLAKRRKLRNWSKEKNRAYHKEYMQRPEVKARAIEKIKQYEEQWPDKARVHRALHWAVWAKKIIKPRACQECCRTGRIEGHHYLGYAWENRFDVQWLCKHCHAAKHLRYPDEAPIKS